MDHGSWIMDHGSWIMDHGSWIMDHGSWIMDHGYGNKSLPRWYCKQGSHAGSCDCQKASTSTKVLICRPTSLLVLTQQLVATNYHKVVLQSDDEERQWNLEKKSPPPTYP
jgi:hypothetical protein